MNLNNDQSTALKLLQGTGNVFLTGAAGSGKSYVVREYLKKRDVPILASTGAAAILVGGRTFHSYFGLGILEGGIQETIKRALRNKKLVKRIENAVEVVIDEVSMLSGPTLQAAECIVKQIRGNTRAWGGIRIVAVGDFAQLPPVNPFDNQKKQWAFLDPVWSLSEFNPVVLKQIMRTTDSEFLEILNLVRIGQVTNTVSDFLDSKTTLPPKNFAGTRLFSRRDDVERYNLERLDKIKKPVKIFETLFIGKEKEIEKFKKNSPISESIQLKVGALIMLRQNDPERRWMNGSLGHIEDIDSETLTIKLIHNDEIIFLEKTEFTLLDADGNRVVTAVNFPISLAWALTIHKAQGATIDRMSVNLIRLWEPGQAYVALSRATHPEGIFIEGWDKTSIFADPYVTRFHSGLTEN